MTATLTYPLKASEARPRAARPESLKPTAGRDHADGGQDIEGDRGDQDEAPTARSESRGFGAPSKLRPS